MVDLFQLEELELDLLAELFNIGVGNAANSLSKMVSQEVKLSVPSVDFRTVSQMTSLLGDSTSICSVSQHMAGAFEAKSMLIFPEESSMEVVRQLMGEDKSDEVIADLQEEALNEIGNIVLNACIGAIGATLNENFEVGLPEFQKGYPAELLSSSVTSENDVVLIIRINMELSVSQVKGYLAFILGSTSLVNLQNCLEIMLAKLSA